MEGREQTGGTRKYERAEKRTPVEVTHFDGEGLISKQYVWITDRAYCREHIHTSFQIRLPFVKGMLHQVDFKTFLHDSGGNAITDLWGVRRPLAEMDVIADALELGPLRSPDVSLSTALEQRIEAAMPKGAPVEVLRMLVWYYLANRQEDTDWVMLPVVNFDAYFGKNFSHKWLNDLPEDTIVQG